MRRTLSVLMLLLFAVVNVQAQPKTLRHQLVSILKHYNATVGISVEGPASVDTLSVNGTQHFPMQSVFKFHIALAVLDRVDHGKLSLDQTISVSRQEWVQDIYSPLRDENPDGGLFTLQTLLRYNVSLSDNNACDLLLRLLGGPVVVHRYLRSVGINDVQIEVSETVMQATWEAQYKNWSTPPAATRLLKLFNSGKLLTAKSQAILMDMMINSPTGMNRIKGQLPPGIIVAHKTGTSGRNDAGMMAAVNDIAILTLPGNKQVYLAVFVSQSMEDTPTNEKIIAEVSKCVADYFMN